MVNKIFIMKLDRQIWILQCSKIFCKEEENYGWIEISDIKEIFLIYEIIY